MKEKMEIIRTVARLRQAVAEARAEGKTIGLVPTMGALHDGHMSLMRCARGENDIVVASVFVNPTQFNNPEDLATYPRTEEADCMKLESAGVDVAFIPSVEEMYPEPDTRQFALGAVAETMEGAMRPGHFNGVAQVVSKLFSMVTPTRAYFGVIHRVLSSSVDWAKDHTLAETKRYVTDEINSFPHMEVEYYEIVDPLTMQPLESWDSPCSGRPVGCVTAYCGKVRLIDNIRY